MYDVETSTLIRSSPPVDGIDSARLPELLTRCYAQISTVRLRLAQGSTEGEAELNETVGQLRSLALTLEVFAALSPDDDGRHAAAFVSASAHQLLSQAYRLLPGFEAAPLKLASDSVPSEIACGLLFLSAGYPADAAEAVAGIGDIAGQDHRVGVLQAVIDLCRGDLRGALAQPNPNPEGLDTEDRAEAQLWTGILRAIRILATRFLEAPNPDADLMSQFRNALSDVREDCVREITLPAFLGDIQHGYSAFPGPHHLATLLLAAGQGIDERGLTDVPDPIGPPAADWRRFIAQRLLSRPFLWTNHMDAVQAGLLNRGRSATISFPTGAGKSTLSELKIAATVMGGRKVIYLAPTLALVGQVSRSIREMLVEAEVEEDEVDDQLFVLPEIALEKFVSVMTPERCLLLLTLFPESFSDIGLVVFDECHALHMAPDSASNRPISAMLGLIRLLELAADADVLLMSAMMKNGDQLAGWLHRAFGKDTLSFDAAWKPTRQARGGVIFASGEIADARSLVPAHQGRIPQSRLGARPHALVCLQQTWTSNSLQNYRVLPLTNSSTKLNGSRFSNGNPRVTLDTSACAISLAMNASERGLKTIVFFHSPTSITPALEAARTVVGGQPLELLPLELALQEAASIELGGDQYVILPNAVAGGHYGDLLKEERAIVEDAFKRPNGIRVLFSTNTLAQGMNLPADLVVIVRTGAYNAEAGSYQNIEVHDLLNAAGRAGRAGHSANGLVLVIPDRIVTFNATGQVTGGGLGHLKDGLLAQDDRCLDIADPIEVVLDALAAGHPIEERALSYLLLRLPPATKVEDAVARGRRFFAKSLAAYRANVAGEEASFEEKINRAFVERSRVMGDGVSLEVEEMCSATGLPPAIVEGILLRIEAIDDPDAMSAWNWGEWSFSFLENSDDLRSYLFRSTRSISCDTLLNCLRLWISGSPLSDIERALGTQENRLGFLKGGRRFGRETVRELSYLVGLVAQVVLKTTIDGREAVARSASNAAILLREGYDTRDKWALGQQMRQEHWTRVRVHQEADAWLRYVENPVDPHESTRDLFRRVGAGMREYRDRTANG